MIIKSTSRKTTSFSQLINYLNQGRVAGDDYFFKHNIYSHTPYYIAKEYNENFKTLKRRVNSNALYHEIISLKHQNNLTIQQQREILKDLMNYYTNSRANNNMVYGVIHEQHNQIHCHLMISSNELASERNKRLSKKEFAGIKAEMQNYAYEKYPKLEYEKMNNKKARAKARVIDNEVQFKKRTGRKSERELMKERLQSIFEKSSNPQDFISSLEKEKIQAYQRGKTFGFLDEATGKKYRLKTLELEKEFSDMDRSFTKFTKEASLKASQRGTRGTSREASQEALQEALQNENQKARGKSHESKQRQEFDKKGFNKVESEKQEKFRAQIQEARKARNHSFTKS
jgi:hypothetical protein